MIATTYDSHRYENQFEDLSEDTNFERFSYRDRAEFPVRSQASRTRARMRGRATAAGRNKVKSFHGVNRRGRGKQWTLAR
jgi:hypothetical protein